MAETVKVIVRCRPMNSRERNLDCKCVVFMDHDMCTCSIVNPSDSSTPPKTFTFDGVYDTNSTTEQIYNEIAYPLIEGVLEGYNCTVFAYGQTGCGKSFTMQGVPQPTSQKGVIPRSFEHIFEGVAVTEGTKYLVLASYLEIYNEEIRDLLGEDVKRRLDLKEHADKGVYVQDLSQHPVQSVNECEVLMECGWKNRSVGATLMNADSSRSHSIFSITLEMLREGEHIRSGKLNLVDLAGSERQAKTGATGDRLKEATKINLSLSALGNVISALVDGKSKHIPYRDSKLTRLLQDSLGGNTKTLMIACLSPADNNYDETLSTLRYANRAKNIKNKPKINEDPKDAMLREYQEEINNLRDMLQITSSGVPQEIMVHEVRLQFEDEMKRLREEYEREQNSKHQLQSDLQALRDHYEKQLSSISRQASSNMPAVTIDAKTPSELIVSEALRSENMVVNGAQQEVLLRLKKLQESMVGGERAGDRELKEKRLRKKRASERRLQALAKVLSKVDDEEGVVLQVYDDIQQELRIKTDTLRKCRTKVKALEREILDLQSEFENERTDYLETIRKQEQQLKLYQQISEKIATTLKKECSYSDLEKIKNLAVWSDDTHQWKLPDLMYLRTKLPPAGVFMSLAPDTSLPHGQPSNTNSSGGSSSGKSSCSSTGRNSCPDSPPGEASIMQRLQRSEEEDIAGNYFKPKRATELLNRAREDASRAFNTWRVNAHLAEYTNRSKAAGSNTHSFNNLLNASLNQTGFHSSLNGLNLNATYGGSSLPNSLWTNVSNSPANGWIGNSYSISPDQSIKRPARLEALPLLNKKENCKVKNGISQRNKMDLI